MKLSKVIVGIITTGVMVFAPLAVSAQDNKNKDIFFTDKDLRNFERLNRELFHVEKVEFNVPKINIDDCMDIDFAIEPIDFEMPDMDIVEVEPIDFEEVKWDLDFDLEFNIEVPELDIGEINIPENLIVDIEKIKNVADKDLVIVSTGSQGEPRSALSTLSALTPQKNSVFLGPDDVVIFSSRIIPGNEKSIALLQRKLKAKGVKIITDRDDLVHVSGHYAGPDLQAIYRLLKPKIALPVHGEALELKGHADLAQKCGTPFTFALEDGEVIALSDEPEILGEVPTGILAVDGKHIVHLDAEVIRKRRKMMDDGSLVVTLVVDQKGHVLGTPQLSTFGLLDSETDDAAKLSDLICRAVDEVPAEHKASNTQIDQSVRSAIRKFLNEFYGKKPLIDVHLVRI